MFVGKSSSVKRIAQVAKPKKRPEMPRVFSWLSPKCEIRNTEKCGKGVFAKEFIQKDEIVCIGGGYILTVYDEDWFDGEMADKPIEIADDFYIGPCTDDDVALCQQVLINHSCSPNVGIKGQIIYVAMKPILPNSEISCDYAMICAVKSKSKLVFGFKCKCGSPDCRGEVTESDWSRPDLQERYKGYFSWYIQEKIDKLNRQKQTLSARGNMT